MYYKIIKHAKRKQLTNEQSFQIIQQMISVAQQNVSQNGFHFLLWGFLNVGAAISHYIFLSMNINEFNASLPWLAMILIGIPIGLLFEFKKSKIEKRKTFTDHFYKWVWISFGISLFVAEFYCNVFHVNIFPIILTFAAFATMISGQILQFNPLKVGGIIFWLTGIVACFFTEKEDLLVYAFAITIGYILPGILLWKKFKAQKSV